MIDSPTMSKNGNVKSTTFSRAAFTLTGAKPISALLKKINQVCFNNKEKNYNQNYSINLLMKPVNQLCN